MATSGVTLGTANGLLLIASAFVMACDETPSAARQESLQGPGLRPSPAQAPSAEAQDDDHVSARIGRQVPGFGGAFIEAGILNVYLTDPSAEAAARRVILAELAKTPRRPMEIRIRKGRYGWAQLREWRSAALTLHRIRGVVWSGVDQVSNGIAIGVEDAAARAQVEQALAALNIPREAVTIRPARPAVRHEGLTR
jgi:hypothetical protein